MARIQQDNKIVFFANVSVNTLENQAFQFWVIGKFSLLGKQAK